MAESYYGYVEHAVDSQVNWASVGKSISGMITDEQKRREEKKAELDKMTQEVANKMAEAPVGTQQDVNKFTANYVGDATSLNLLLNRQLKAGKLQPKDFLLRNQNIKQGTESVFTLAKNLEKHYASTMDGIDKGDFLPVDIWKGMKVEKYSDLRNVRGLFSDTDSSVNLGLFDEKTKNYTNVQSVAFLNNMISRNTATYKGVDSDIKTFADDKGKVTIQTIIDYAKVNHPGSTLSVENPELFNPSDPALQDSRFQELRKEYLDAEQLKIDAIFAANNGLMTVIFNKLDKYTADDITDDVAEYEAANGDKVLVSVDSNGNVSLNKDGKFYDKHRGEASRWIRKQMRNQIDRSIEYKTDLSAIKPATPRKSVSSASKSPYPPFFNTVWQAVHAQDPSQRKIGQQGMEGLDFGGKTISKFTETSKGNFNIEFTDGSENNIGAETLRKKDEDALLRSFTDRRGGAPTVTSDSYTNFKNKSDVYKNNPMIPMAQGVFTSKNVGGIIKEAQTTYNKGADEAIKKLNANAAFKKLGIKAEKVDATHIKLKIGGRTSKKINVSTTDPNEIDPNNTIINSFLMNYYKETSENKTPTQYKTNSGIEYSIIPTEQNIA